MLQNKTKEARAALKLKAPLSAATRLHCASSLVTVLDRAGKAAQAAARSRLQLERQAAANLEAAAAEAGGHHFLLCIDKPCTVLDRAGNADEAFWCPGSSRQAGGQQLLGRGRQGSLQHIMRSTQLGG